MAIELTDIAFYRSSVVSDAGGNGAYEDLAAVVTHNTLNNLFPNVSQAERTSGVTRYRKTFFHNNNADNYVLYSGRLWVDFLSPGNDYHRIYSNPSTRSLIDTQTDITAADFFGTGLLNSNVASGVSSIDVEFQVNDVSAALVNGVLLYITDKDNPTGALGNSEFATVSTVSWNGSVATIGLSGQLVNGYNTTRSGTPCRVAMVLDVGNLVASISGQDTSHLGSGTYTGTIVAGNAGAEYDTIRIEFDDATHFHAVGTRLGSLGSGTVGTNFSPTNPRTGNPYFTLPSAGWGGTHSDGDYMTFNLRPSAVGVWVKEVVPAASPSLSGNYVNLGFFGESA